MANQSTRKAALRIALSGVAKQRELRISPDAIDYFADRASQHIESRFIYESEKDSATVEAITNVERLITNLITYGNQRNLYAISRTNAESYVALAVGCFFPFCRP